MEENISIPFFKYRDCCRQIWNNYFIELDKFDGTGWDIYEYFQEVTEKLFNAMIAGQLFHKELTKTGNSFYNEIIIRPNLGPLGFEAMWAKSEGPIYEWKVVWLKSEANEFRFMEFFDWTVERIRDNQYVRARLIDSDEHKDLIGNDFILEAWDVEFIKKREE